MKQTRNIQKYQSKYVNLFSGKVYSVSHKLGIKQSEAALSKGATRVRAQT